MGGKNMTIGHTINLRHGHSVGHKHSLTYTSWRAMKQRILNPNADSYQYYGGRGIRVCSRWMVFDAFLADMGEREAGLTLDRIDTNGDYEPSNVRWSDAKTQATNRRQRKKSRQNEPLNPFFQQQLLTKDG